MDYTYSKFLGMSFSAVAAATGICCMDANPGLEEKMRAIEADFKLVLAHRELTPKEFDNILKRKIGYYGVYVEDGSHARLQEQMKERVGLVSRTGIRENYLIAEGKNGNVSKEASSDIEAMDHYAGAYYLALADMFDQGAISTLEHLDEFATHYVRANPPEGVELDVFTKRFMRFLLSPHLNTDSRLSFQ